MIAALKAEVRKLLTVRATYVIVVLAVVLVGIFGTILGYHFKGPDLQAANQLSDAVTGAITTVALIGSLAGLLLLSNEYRHNTILYSLTTVRRRSTLLAAKILVVTVYSFIFTAVICLLAPLFTSFGVHLAGHSLGPQQIELSSIIWRVLFYSWGYGMAALLFAAFIRSQIGAIVALFVVPGTVEGLLSLLLKSNSVYMPFNALNAVAQRSSSISFGYAALVFLGYLVVGWIAAWMLFLRRDAN